MSTPLAAVILAGGASRRMGRDKATMPHPGRPEITMVEHTVTVLGGRCAPVFVVAAPGQRLPDLPATVLHDEVPGQGPLAATARGLRAAAEAGLGRAFVSAVDMPNLSAGLVDLLTEDPDAEITLPWDGRDHYLAGVYRTALAELIDGLVVGGEHSMRALTDVVPTRRVPVEAVALTNLNEADDLR